MRVLGIITTPAGHRASRLLHFLSGKPLLAYTADAVLRSRRLARAVLTTDAGALVSLGEELGFETAESAPLETTVRQMEQSEGRQYDAVAVLPAAHPLRTAADIDSGIQLLESTGADVTATFTTRPAWAARLAGIDAHGRVQAAASEIGAQRIYVRDGSVTCWRRAKLGEDGELAGLDCRAHILPPERVCVVEEDFDLYLAEHLLRYERRATA